VATVEIAGNDYPAYADVDFADEYLAGDFSRASAWAALGADPKGTALVSATRLLQRQLWRAGAPATDDPPAVVAEAASLLAADIASKPGLVDGGSTGSNVKAVGAGSARVEFFRPTAGTPLPAAAFDLLRGLLGPADGSGSDSVALDNTAYGSDAWQRSRFDPTDYALFGEGVDESTHS